MSFHSFQRWHLTVDFRNRESLWKISMTAIVFAGKTKGLLPILAQKASHIQKYFLFLSSHQRWFLDSLSRSCILEKSRLNKDLMKGLSMINQDRIHILFSIFLIQNKKETYYLRTRNYRDFRWPISNEGLSRKTCIDHSTAHLATKIVLFWVIPTRDPHRVLQCHECTT